MYPYGKSNKPRLSYAVAMVLMGIDAALASDPEDALTIAESLPDDGERVQPIFGMEAGERASNGVCPLIDWFSDGDDSRYESN